jgi:hypothetical protein
MAITIQIKLNLQNDKEAKKLLGDLEKDYTVDAKVDTSQVKKGVNSIKSSLKEVGSSITNTFAMFGLAMSGIRQAGQILKGVFEFKNVARDAEEIKNKYFTVFESIEDKARITADSFATSFKLATSTAQELLGDTGDILVGFGFDEDMALDLSERVNTLAMDLASFTNYSGGAKGASEALTKAMLGETESAKALGIVLRQGTKEFKQQVEQLKETNGYTENQARALTLLNEAYEQSGKAVGDFSRTQEQLANQERILKEAWKELKIFLGDGLIPVFASGTKAVSDLITSLTKTSVESMRESKQAIKDFEAEAQRLNDLEAEYKNLRNQASLNAEEHEKLKDIINEISEIVPEAATGFDVYGNAIDINTNKLNNFIQKQRASLRLQFQDEINDVVKDYQNKMKQHSAAYENFINKQNRMKKIRWEYQNYYKQAIKSYGSEEKAIANVGDVLEKYQRRYQAAKQLFAEAKQEYFEQGVGAQSALNNMIRSLEGAGINFNESPANIAYQLGLDLKKDRALIDALISRYKILNSISPQRNKPDGEGGELTYSDKEIAAAQKQIETWLQQRQAALRSQGEAVQAEYSSQLQAAEVAYGKDSEEYKQAKVQLWAWRQEELEKIEQERLDTIDESQQKQLQAEQKGYEQQIKLLQAKKELGIDVTEELQRVQAEYVAWAKQAYGEDSQEYIDAMRDKKETTEQFWQSQHEFASGIFDSIASTWRTAWDTIIDTSMTGSQRVMAIWDSFKQSVWAVIGDITQKYIKDQLTQLAITESTEAAKTATHKAGILERIALDIWAGIKYVAVKLYEIAASITKFFSFLGPLAPVATGGVMAGIVAYLNSFKEGFKMGGFTGSGDPAEEAGVVHKGEYVFEAPLVSKYGSFLANLRGALQKGIAPAELFIPNVQFPQLATQPSPQIGYASGGEAVSNSKILQRLKAIEDAIVNKKMDGVLDLRDNRGGVDRYKAHLKAKDEYERKFR